MNTHWPLWVGAAWTSGPRLGRMGLPGEADPGSGTLASHPGAWGSLASGSGGSCRELEKHDESKWSCVTGIGEGQVSQRGTSASSPLWGSRARAVRPNVSFHQPGRWFPCRGSTMGAALIRREVLGRWLLVISKTLQMQTQQDLLCCLSVTGLWVALIWGCSRCIAGHC